MVIETAFVAALAVLNRVRGGGFWGDRLPGHPRFYVSTAVGLLSWALMPWRYALAAAACYLAWSLLPWGRWFDLGRLPAAFVDGIRPPSIFERAVDDLVDRFGLIGRGHDHAAFLIRNVVAFAPAMLILSHWFALAPIAWVALYELAWRVRPAQPIELAEILTGAAWGVFLVVASWGLS